MTDTVNHGPYELRADLIRGALTIMRRDPDRRRVVAYVETIAQWDRFVAALEAGESEVDAVHAIDRQPDRAECGCSSDEHLGPVCLPDDYEEG